LVRTCQGSVKALQIVALLVTLIKAKMLLTNSGGKSEKNAIAGLRCAVNAVLVLP
jgi:hypothetical protein